MSMEKKGDKTVNPDPVPTHPAPPPHTHESGEDDDSVLHPGPQADEHGKHLPPDDDDAP
jgi:hypothetical protein